MLWVSLSFIKHYPCAEVRGKGKEKRVVTSGHLLGLCSSSRLLLTMTTSPTVSSVLLWTSSSVLSAIPKDPQRDPVGVSLTIRLFPLVCHISRNFTLADFLSPSCSRAVNSFSL